MCFAGRVAGRGGADCDELADMLKKLAKGRGGGGAGVGTPRKLAKAWGGEGRAAELPDYAY